MKNRLLKIVNHYGIRKQLKYFQSEIFELDEAIIDYENYEELVDIEKNTKKDLKSHIVEEIADVTVMLKQFQYYYDISDEEIENIMNFKIERQLERIEKENK